MLMSGNKFRSVLSDSLLKYLAEIECLKFLPQECKSWLRNVIIDRHFSSPLQDKFLSKSFHAQKCFLYSGALKKINGYHGKDELKEG